MDKPSGSFVSWNNTLCNPLAPAMEQSRSAWDDGYESGRLAEREACAKVCEEGGRDGSGRIHVQAWGCAKAIRARGQE